jgi:hypothetical protein
VLISNASYDFQSSLEKEEETRVVLLVVVALVLVI